MKNTKLLFALFAMMLFSVILFGQNGNMVISEVQVYDLGNGRGIVEVRVSGNLANTVTGGSFTTGQCRACGGPLTVESSGNNNSVILSGNFQLAPSIGHGPNFVEIDIQVQGAIIINGKIKKGSKNDRNYN